jgi:light-regulated signal transduction histidine kinase (bacteriophytochrome)
MPAFGKADLSNCEREQIHLAGSIQPHGALLVVRDSDHVVIQASANSVAFLGLGSDILGKRLDAIDGDLARRIAPLLQTPLHAIPRAVRCTIGRPSATFDCLAHRPPDGNLIIELERAGPSVDLSNHVESAVKRIVTASSLRSLCDEAGMIFQELTGYDRVMVYRFDDEGHGEVFSERRKPELEAFLGNRYPASDIPQIARRLYERNRVRVLADIQYKPVPITPRLSPDTGQDIDMSLCFLRSHSPIHVQYLKNMGVCATLVASLLVGGRLWGLIACHHYVPRFVHFEVRAVVELLAEAVATRIAALESFVQAQAELIVRRLEQRMVEAISRDGDWRIALFDTTQSLLQPLGASGAALVFDGQVLSTGDVPATQDVREISAWMDQQPHVAVTATASLGLDEPRFASLTPVASGVMAVPVSANAGEYLMWFRPERIRTVTWGGDPQKPVIIGNDPTELSPRRSFAQWHQLVEGTSDPWTPADTTAARLIGETVADVAFQFRSVRMLIAQDQLEQASRRVRTSDQPVIIADAKGRILLTNEAFEKLLRATHPHLQWLDDLPPLFAEPIEVRRNLRSVMQTMQSWRGEARLLRELNETKPLMVRADPVYASPDRVLGFVLHFTDLSERKAAETARRRFQEGILERQPAALRLDSWTDVVYQNVLSSVLENAQLAALEITYGADTARMPDMLDSVRASVARTAEVLERLIWHASPAELRKKD